MREEKSSESTKRVVLRHDKGRELKGLKGREELRERERERERERHD